LTSSEASKCLGTAVFVVAAAAVVAVVSVRVLVGDLWLEVACLFDVVVIHRFLLLQPFWSNNIDHFPDRSRFCRFRRRAM
jgi:hypothetical protein